MITVRSQLANQPRLHAASLTGKWQARGSPTYGTVGEALPLVPKGAPPRVVKTAKMLEQVPGSHLCSSATGSLCLVQGSL